MSHLALGGPLWAGLAAIGGRATTVLGGTG